MRVLVTGGRDYNDASFVFAVLDRVHAKRAITLLIEGGARGADRLGRRWAEARNVPLKTVEADWERYKNRAGPVRNCKMLREEKPEFVVAFRGGSGTRHMMKIAREAGVPVLETWRYQNTEE